jgi:peroxiredoxin
MKLSRPVLISLAAAAALVLAWLTWQSLTRPHPAPQVSFTLIDGTRLSTEQLRGQVVLVNFWATSCVTCVREMPQLAATYAKFRDRGYRTIAVAMSHDTPAFIERFVQTRQLPFAVTHDASGELALGFGDVRLTPTTFLINARGEIVKRYVGAPDFAELHALIDRLLPAR